MLKFLFRIMFSDLQIALFTKLRPQNVIISDLKYCFCILIKLLKLLHLCSFSAKSTHRWRAKTRPQVAFKKLSRWEQPTAHTNAPRNHISRPF